MKTAGIILAIAGLVMLLVTGFNIVTKEKVAEIGPVEINKKEHHTVNWSPIAGAILLAGGVLILTSSKNKS
jgi:hypothetical protein